MIRTIIITIITIIINWKIKYNSNNNNDNKIKEKIKYNNNNDDEFKKHNKKLSMYICSCSVGKMVVKLTIFALVDVSIIYIYF